MKYSQIIRSGYFGMVPDGFHAVNAFERQTTLAPFPKCQRATLSLLLFPHLIDVLDARHEHVLISQFLSNILGNKILGANLILA